MYDTRSYKDDRGGNKKIKPDFFFLGKRKFGIKLNQQTVA